MKKTLLIALLICCFFPLIAQEYIPKKPRVYQAWIKLNNKSTPVQGIFYQVSDSSIILSGKKDTSLIRAYNFRNIELIKVRRIQSVKRGVITGSSIGAGFGILAGLSVSKDLGPLSSLISSYLGFSFGVVGAGVGAVCGTIKDRIPIKSSLENFEKYRGSLQDYSFRKEKGVPARKFIHQFYAGFSMGPSFASAGFAPLVPAIGYKGMEKRGTGSQMSIGYRFTERMGIRFTQQYFGKF